MVYNTPVALKFINPAGVIVYHNTIIAENRTAQRLSNAHFQNNLFLGTDAPVGISVLGGPTAYSTYDYNGYRPNRGAEFQYSWLGPKPGVRVDYDSRRTRRSGSRRSRNWPPPRGRRPTASRSTTTSSRACVRRRRRTRRSPGTPYHAADLDFRLKPGSKAVDAGVRLPNVNDGFGGKAPDLGAYEVGQPLPIYGPRWLKGRPFYQ